MASNGRPRSRACISARRTTCPSSTAAITLEQEIHKSTFSFWIMERRESMYGSASSPMGVCRRKYFDIAVENRPGEKVDMSAPMMRCGVCWAKFRAIVKPFVMDTPVTRIVLRLRVAATCLLSSLVNVAVRCPWSFVTASPSRTKAAERGASTALSASSSTFLPTWR